MTLTIILSLFSCDKVKRKGHQAVNKAKTTLAEKKADIGDKIIARFDAYEPDTRFNKKRFYEFFSFYPTQDVKNIYCHADELGIDHDYQFAFNCDTATITKIISYLNLTKSEQPDNFSSGLWNDFPWWDSTKITTLKPYWTKGKHETYRYLWYDTSGQKAYYFTFDM